MLFVTIATLLAIVAIVLRQPSVEREIFPNEDVAGITYNADLLRRGLVPMKDNIETKAPGTFFVTHWAWQLFGRSIRTFEGAGIAWAILAALAVLATGWSLYGPLAGALSAFIFTIWSIRVAGVTANYNLWMMAPYGWAAAFFVFSLRTRRFKWIFLTGLMVGLSAMMKRQAATIVPLYPLIWFMVQGGFSPSRRSWREIWRVLISYGAGLLAAFVPFVVYYLIEGGLTDFVGQYFFSSKGWSYVLNAESARPAYRAWHDGLDGLWRFQRFPVLLATLTLFGALARGERRLSTRASFLAGHFLFSAVGVSLGLRFYSGYYLQLLPSLAWLAAHPSGPLLIWFRTASWPTAKRARSILAMLLGLIVLAISPYLIQDLSTVQTLRMSRPKGNGPRLEAARVGAFIKTHSEHEDSIWVWGRWGWPVYFFADRISVTPYYKVLGIITNILDNTWRYSGSKTRFERKGPHAQIYHQLAEGKPKFIVVAKNEDVQEWSEFIALLERDYHLVSSLRLRFFQLYQRTN